MKAFQASQLVLLSLLVSTGAIAANVKITGTIPSAVQINRALAVNSVNGNVRSLATVSTTPVINRISLERVELTQEARKYIAAAASKKPRALFSANLAARSSLPDQVYLGMNNVPVLDQGQHGTCVTFADTAAVDAVRSNTDYISQLCNLELGSYFENQDNEYNKQHPKNKKEVYTSGWDGSFNQIVLGQMQKYGIVTKSYQTQYGCGTGKKTSEVISIK